MIIRLRNLFAVTMLSSVFSLLSAGLFVILDAVDVAFTEAAVGAGITTVLFLGALSITGSSEKRIRQRPFLPLFIVIAVAGVLIYGIKDVPAFGDPEAPAHKYIAPEYISGTRDVVGIPNVVSAVLASYRGFDTLGETGVIFTAGVGVLLLLNGGLSYRRRRDAAPLSEDQNAHE